MVNSQFDPSNPFYFSSDFYFELIKINNGVHHIPYLIHITQTYIEIYDMRKRTKSKEEFSDKETFHEIEEYIKQLQKASIDNDQIKFGDEFYKIKSMDANSFADVVEDFKFLTSAGKKCLARAEA